MKRLLVIIIISLALQSCASSRAWYKTYCEPSQDIDYIETDYLGAGMDRITYKNGSHEYRHSLYWELDKNYPEYMLRTEDTPFNRFYNEVIIRGLEKQEGDE